MSYPAIGEVLYFFEKSAEKKNLIDYPAQRVRKTITDFAATMSNVGREDLKLWTEESIGYFLKETISYEEKFDTPNAKIHAFNAYQALAAFLRFAARKEYLSLSTTEVDNLLQGIEGDSYLSDPIEPFTPDGSSKKLTKYQDKTSQKYLKLSDEWCTKYINSSDFKPVYGDSDDLMIKMLMGTLTVDIYQIYRKTPNAWTKKAISEVMTYDFVKETAFSDKGINCIGDSLMNLLKFLSKDGLLDQDKADKYIRFIDEVQLQMVKHMLHDQDVNSYKRISWETINRNIDPTDQEKLREFGDEFFAEGGFVGLKKQRELEAENAEPFDPLSLDDVEYEPELLNDPEKLKATAMGYEDGSDLQYMRTGHVLNYGTKLWNLVDAEKYHTQALELGLKLYLKRQQYDLSEDIPGRNVVDTVVQTVDFFYGEYLTGPADWRVSNMTEVGGFMRGHTSDEGMSIFKNLIRLMRDEGIISYKQADALLDALFGRKKSVGSVSLSKGKIRRGKKKKKKRK